MRLTDVSTWRDRAAAGLVAVFMLTIVADIVLPDYDLPPGLIALIGGMMGAWFALGMRGRGGNGNGSGRVKPT